MALQIIRSSISYGGDREICACDFFFFNGGKEKQFHLEDRELVPSPKVATYDLQPEMSVAGVGEELIKAMKNKEKDYDFVMCNLAPPDMVGHTGEYEPTVKACEATDSVIGKIKDACSETGFVLLVTADHGNAEKMIDEKGGKHTAHTTYPVPFVMFDPVQKLKFGEKEGTLPGVAPTVLEIMELPVPKEMTGKSLLAK